LEAGKNNFPKAIKIKSIQLENKLLRDILLGDIEEK
jgi:hypothetical protein